MGVLEKKESELEKRIHETKTFGKKRIALINPPSFFLTDDKVFFSLGLLYLAGVAREAGHDVHIEDLAGREDYIERAAMLAKEGKFDLYGLTATSPQYGFAANILESIKSVDSNSRVVIGGPHATMFANLRNRRKREFLSSNPKLISRPRALEEKIYDSDVNFASLERFDQIIEGEELGIFEVLKSLNEPIPEKWVHSGVVENLDELPFPARDLIDMQTYTFKDDGTPKFDIGGGPATSVISQRGCPFGCLFCSGRNVPQYRKIKVNSKLRAHSPERMVSEFNMINEQYGLERFMIYDDELNLENSRFLSLMIALEENNLRRVSEGLNPYHFRGFVKSELFLRNPNQAKMMKRAGFSELLSGFESGSDRILKHHVRKNTSFDINTATSELAFQNGMQVKALTMTGHPTETYDDIMKTHEFLDGIGKMARKYGCDWNFDITVLTPYPGSPIYDSMVKNQWEHKEEYGKVLLSKEGVPELYMKEIDFANEGVGAYKTAPGEEVVLIRTPTLSSKELFFLRGQIDHEIRSEYHIQTYARDKTDIEHSMGQSTP